MRLTVEPSRLLAASLLAVVRRCLSIRSVRSTGRGDEPLGPAQLRISRARARSSAACRQEVAPRLLLRHKGTRKVQSVSELMNLVCRRSANAEMRLA